MEQITIIHFTPSSVNWYALLKDFDNFNEVRCKVGFYDASNKNELTKDGTKPPIIKSQSNKITTKWKTPKVERFLSRIEQDIFSDTLRKKYKSTISRAETQALNKWRANMNNADKEFILRIQDKGNRFIFVDKKTDKKKANK